MPILKHLPSILLGTLVMLIPAGAAGGLGSREEQTPPRGTITVTDALDRRVTVRGNPRHVICSGAGCLRLLTYLECGDRAIAVDDLEGRRLQFAGRPYALANPGFADLPVFGEFRGRDNPELIVSLEPPPEVIFRTFPGTGTDPVELERRTGIPVVALDYGDFFGYTDDLFTALRTMADVLGKKERAEEVISYLRAVIADLASRTAGIPAERKPACYAGGIAFRGPRGIESTEPAYLPFLFLGARSVAFDPAKDLRDQLHADVAREKIVAWDPEVVFVDASTLMSDPLLDAVTALRTDPAYRGLRAVKRDAVYVVIPFKWYGQNYGSVLANAYFVGKVLFPDRFADVVPSEKADEIYRTLLGKPVFADVSAAFRGLVFERIPF